ncbi:histidinol-phosphate transaminase [Thiomicrospira aerophila]|nr:histidinol-phosphate transaminase [Thiomicrospira aerophila]
MLRLPVIGCVNNMTAQFSSVDQAVAQLVRPEIQALHAYHVPPSAKMVKLDAMENPYDWPPLLRQAWLDKLAELSLNRYPDPGATELHNALHQHLGLAAETGLLFGNGSDELIQLLIMAVNRPGAKVMSIAPTFVMYDMIARFLGADYCSVALNDDFELDVDAFVEAMAQQQPALVFIAYPNNPTGNALSRQDLIRIIEAAPGLVVVDEAYHAFAEDSFILDTVQYPHLLVMRTFSKVGLAGLRLGYLVGPKAWIEQVDKLRLPYNINTMTQASALVALSHWSILAEQAQQICDDRIQLSQALAALPGIKVYATAANFIVVRLNEAGPSAPQVFEGLKAAGILIKNLSPQGGVLTNCLRITIGSPTENNQLIEALRLLLKPV